MKIWINKKTGETYPAIGGNFSIYENEMSNPKVSIFIRGIGWKKYPSKNWESKEIPNLIDRDEKNYDDKIKMHPDVFRAYVKEYGKEVAMAQLPCADFCKYAWAAVLLDPNYPNDDIQKWFYETFNVQGDPKEYPDYFKKSIWSFMQSELGMICGKFVFDIIGFEEHLVKEFDYNLDANESISDFIIRKFGQKNHDKFKGLFVIKPIKKELKVLA